MLNIFRLFVMTLLLGPVAMLSSCSDPEPMADDVTGEDKVDVLVNFNFTVADTKPYGASRATTGGYEPGQGFENYVDVASGDFRIYLFTTENKYFGSVSDVTVIPRAVSDGAVTYNVDGKVSAEMARLRNFKVCILANWKEYPALTPGDDVQKLWTEAPETIYDYDGSELSESHTIPFYGIKEFNNVSFVDNVRTFLGDVFLLRAYAKVEVNLGSSVAPVESVTITRVNMKGFKAPKNVDTEDKYIHNSYEEDWVNDPNIVVGCATQDIKMTLVEGDAAKAEVRKFVAYVPEYDNTSASAVKSRIRLNFLTEQPGTDGYLDFKYYEKTGPHAQDEAFDLLRNYIYRYDVTQTGVVVDVQPYAEVKLRPEFGLERDSEGNIVIRDSEGQIIKILMTDGQLLVFKPFDVPNIGEATGVFDEANNVRLAYFDDGSMMVYNYATGEGIASTKPVEIRWELYTPLDGEYGRYLCEEFEEYRWDWLTSKFYLVCLHNFYDERGCLVERYRYNSRDDFDKRTPGDEGSLAAVLVDYKDLGNREKDVYYYEGGTPYMIVHVRWTDVPALDDDGVEIEGKFEKELVETYEYLRKE